jgi:hypothetical protein
VALVGDGRSNREVAGTRAQRAHGEKIPVPHFREAGDLQPSRTRALCGEPRRYLASGVGRGWGRIKDSTNLEGNLSRLSTEPSAFETDGKALYKCEEPILVTDSRSNSRRWTVIASALLCAGLGVVVMYTKRNAFFSPLAVVVVAAIGLAAVLLQLRYYNREHTTPVQAPVWLNILGVAFALAALFADFLGLGWQMAQVVALGAVGSFAISSAMILHAFRKGRISSK